MKISAISKTVVTGLIPFSLLFSPIAASAETASTQAPQDLVLTIDKALQKTLGNSVDLERKRIAMENSDLENRLAKIDAKAITIDSIGSLDDAQTKYEDSASAYKDMRIAYFTYKDAERKLKLDTTLAYNDAVHAYSSHDQSAMNEALEKLNQFMGESNSREWTITDIEQPAAYTLPTLEEALAIATQNRPDIMQKKEELDFANLKVALITRWSSVGSLEGRIAVNDAKLAKMDYDDAYKVVVDDVTKNYNALKDAIEQKDDAVQRFNEGKQSRSSYQNAIHEYNQTLTNYLYALGF